MTVTNLSQYKTDQAAYDTTLIIII